jgi:hypothetical protein
MLSFDYLHLAIDDKLFPLKFTDIFEINDGFIIEYNDLEENFDIIKIIFLKYTDKVYLEYIHNSSLQHSSIQTITNDEIDIIRNNIRK